jgi:hypothetical protein
LPNILDKTAIFNVIVQNIRQTVYRKRVVSLGVTGVWLQVLSTGDRAGDHGSNARALTAGLAAHGPIS